MRLQKPSVLAWALWALTLAGLITPLVFQLTGHGSSELSGEPGDWAPFVAVHLAETDGHLTFEVQDDGAGFDPSTTSYGTGLQGMADRLSALGGDLQVRTAPGRGTTVEGRLPVRELEPVG